MLQNNLSKILIKNIPFSPKNIKKSCLQIIISFIVATNNKIIFKYLVYKIYYIMYITQNIIFCLYSNKKESANIYFYIPKTKIII